MPRFPNDLVLDILDALIEPGSDLLTPHQSSLDALRNCSLVCREWTLPAQKRLPRPELSTFQFRTIALDHPSRNILARFRSLHAAIATPISKSHILANSIRSVTMLECPTFMDPSRHPLLRINPIEFAQFLVTCPNIERVRVKSGLLQFNAESLGILRSAMGSDTDGRFGNRITELCVQEERSWHRQAVQSLFTEGIFANVSRFSWVIFENETTLYTETLPSRDGPINAHSSGDVRTPWIMPNKLTSLALDVRQRSPFLGFLCALLHSSVKSIHELKLSTVPHSAIVHAETNPNPWTTRSQTVNISSFKDVLRLIGPNLRSLSLGSQSGLDVSNLDAYQAQTSNESPSPPNPQTPTYLFDPIALSSLTPNLQALEFTSCPLTHYLLSLSTPSFSPCYASRLPHTLKTLSLCSPKGSQLPSMFAISLDILSTVIESQSALDVVALEQVVLRAPSTTLEKDDVKENLNMLEGFSLILGGQENWCSPRDWLLRSTIHTIDPCSWQSLVAIPDW
ncbi:uncharacterized protein EI90DRAFT_3010656 [Cantharellus anzutake]|uniref:uncharacterized protein n=1 Tax=Cantharellus anzutake TaxID=1750568 RepID=UPI0019065D19|nr:uncharacterized protein EI90DRAFT_3290431 [Cantharellus anzutake]XP_038923646.1 uncharacterized protein EI90DRAFT_3010656 [Cantharellus anzutake]KAF8328654.1 hypothetical protein EI90DRAFT_3290431 [Cantharellus anzutake]KAF8343758.1 hypothetical protein EI90DRAFT_3010656 [Cantharellus anzutake]